VVVASVSVPGGEASESGEVPVSRCPDRASWKLTAPGAAKFQDVAGALGGLEVHRAGRGELPPHGCGVGRGWKFASRRARRSPAAARPSPSALEARRAGGAANAPAAPPRPTAMEARRAGGAANAMPGAAAAKRAG